MYQFRTEPFGHQSREWEQSREKREWAWFWDMGTGKSKMAIDLAGMLWEAKEITACIIVAPNIVHDQWIDEQLPTHLPQHILERVLALSYRTSKAVTKWQRDAYERLLKHDGFSWLAVSYDGFMTDAGKRGVWDFIKDRKCLYILDESHMVKTPSAKRTISIVASGKYCAWKRALSGTPVANSPFDVYSQVRFLREDFWKKERIESFLSFKHRYGVFKQIRPQHGRTIDVVTGYQRLDELHDILKTISSRVVKSEVMDLPPKLYTQRTFDISPEQRRAYDQLREEFETELESGQMVTSALVVTRLLRFQQLLAGFLPTDEGGRYRFPRNPRLTALEETIADFPGQGVIWAVFDEDVDQIMRLLGPRAVRYDGEVSDTDRLRNKAAFIAGEKQWFVSKASVGGTGLNLTCAELMVYYNNSGNLIHRLQSEDRFHRPGQTRNVTVCDLLARDTHDHHVLAALRRKFNIAAQVTGDQVREWLRST